MNILLRPALPAALLLATPKASRSGNRCCPPRGRTEKRVPSSICRMPPTLANSTLAYAPYAARPTLTPDYDDPPAAMRRWWD